MTRHAKTQRIIDEAATILAAFHPMTVRQVYYQLVSRQVVENNREQYQAVSDALVAARREWTIRWDWIEDRLRGVRGGEEGASMGETTVMLLLGGAPGENLRLRDILVSRDETAGHEHANDCD
jgi:hypothetical protein